MVVVVLLLLLPGVAGAAFTKSFQNSTDVTLEESNSSRNYGSSSKCYVDGSRNSGRERSTLLSWTINSIPKNRTITKATIHLQVTNPSKNTFYVYGLKKPWRESEATWVWATNRVRWSKKGASGSTDRESSYDGRLIARKTGTVKIELDPDLIQEWLDRPTKNYGVIIANRMATDDVGFFCWETTKKIQRPKLVITYK